MSFQASIPIIYYHSVGFKNPAWLRGYHTMDPGIFESQVGHFSRKFNIISLKDYWEIRNGLREPARNPLVITFDDGYLDNWVFVYPVLRKYKIPATIFISPDFIDNRDVIRPFINEKRSIRKASYDIDSSGYMSWNELREMENSGLVSIESHTRTHTRYFSSENLVDFHHPGRDSLYITGNVFPEEKPGYINNPGFYKLIPYGYPVFEEKSSVIARRIWINEKFTEEVIDSLKGYDFSNYCFGKAYALIEGIYSSYLESGSLIARTESEVDRKARLIDEIAGSKIDIEEKLKKKVEFLCWPHGDNSEEVHGIALGAGYLATTSGNLQVSDDDISRIGRRIGMSPFRESKLLSVIRADFRIRKEFSASRYYKIIDRYYKRYIKGIVT